MPNSSDLFLIKDLITTPSSHDDHHVINIDDDDDEKSLSISLNTLNPSSSSSSSSKLKDLSLNLIHGNQIDQNINNYSHSHHQTPKDEHEEEEEGFKTPTSLEHKIPESKQCPLAPRKPKPKPKPSLKRKSHYHQSTPSCLHHLSQEDLQMLFFPFQLSNSHKITKKARTFIENCMH